MYDQVYVCLCLSEFGCMYIYIHVHVQVRIIYVRDQFKTWPVLKPSDGFKAGRTASKRARRFSNVTELSPTALKPAGRFCSLPVYTVNYKRLLDGLKIGCRHSRTQPAGLEL